MALKGTLRDFGLMDIFQLLGSGKKTGTLHLSNDSAEGMVCFYEGRVFFASSTWHREHLGERLVAAGKITHKQLEAALEKQGKAGEPDSGPRLGEILVDAGDLSPKALQSFVQNQIHDSLFDLFRWEDGQVEFRVGDVPMEEDIGISVSVENVIMEASRRLEAWDSIKKKIPSLDTVFSMSFAPVNQSMEIHLRPAEWKLLCQVDGETDINGILATADLDDFQACQILYGMLSAGLIETATESVEERLRKQVLGGLNEASNHELSPPPPPAVAASETEDSGEVSAEKKGKIGFRRDPDASAEVIDRLIKVVEGL